MPNITYVTKKYIFMYMAKKNINIYMGVIGEAYVDKENAWSVLLAAKKNILDVQSIIDATLNIGRPLSEAIANAQTAINKALTVYQLLKSKINECDLESAVYYKLYALLGDLNENDFDDNFSNGGNIYTAQENYAFAVSQQQEIADIQKIANELLEANRLNAVIRCKEYNIAKEIFESMVPEQSISPEDLSDEIEGALIKRIAEVNNNINYVNAVSDEIINISNDVTNRINKIVYGAEDNVVITNETLYWYAGNIDPRSTSLLVEGLGFKMIINNNGQRSYIKQDENGNDIDFGIDGPLKANKWFHHPYHLIQDGYLTAGVDGGKAKYQYWYVAVPRYILTTAGKAQYDEEVTTAINAGREDTIISKSEWARIHKHDTSVSGDNYVESLWPAKPTASDDLHLDDEGRHSYAAFIFNEANTNDNIVDEAYGWQMVTTEATPLTINNVDYDVWRIARNDYNTARLNVYMKLGEAQAEAETNVNRVAYYVSPVKPYFGMSAIHNWTNEEANEYNKTLEGAISTSCYKDYDGRCNCTEFWEGIEQIENINTGIIEDTNVRYGIIRDVNATNAASPNGSAYLLSERKYFTVAEVNEYNKTLEGAKVAGLQEINDGWHVKESREGSVLPIAEAISTNSKIFYVAIPSDLSIFDSEGKDLLANEATSPYTLVYYNMTIDKMKYNVYITGNDEEKFADVINKKGSEEVVPIVDLKYYWYVGIVSPSDPTNNAENTGNNKWTQLTSKPASITINAGPQMPPEVWYIAIPHSYNFQAYDSTGAAPDTAAYTKSQITINNIQYDLFTGAGRAPAVNAVFQV